MNHQSVKPNNLRAARGIQREYCVSDTHVTYFVDIILFFLCNM